MRSLKVQFSAEEAEVVYCSNSNSYKNPVSVPALLFIEFMATKIACRYSAKIHNNNSLFMCDK